MVDRAPLGLAPDEKRRLLQQLLRQRGVAPGHPVRQELRDAQAIPHAAPSIVRGLGEPRKADSDYDVIVIGAGVGGLAAAGSLARAGYRVLVLERRSVVGGCCSTFRRGHFVFDVAVHVIGGCAPDDLIGRWLDDLGVGDEIQLHRLASVYTVDVAGEKIELPANLDELAETLCRVSPSDAAAINRLVEEIRTLGRGMLEGSDQRKRIVWQQTERVSWNEFLSERLRSVKPVLLLNSLCIYAGMEPERLSAASMISTLSTYDRGAYYPGGSSQQFAETLAKGVRRWGGEIRRKAAVERVLLKDGAVAGVRLVKGETITAPVVISNADGTKTFLEMIGAEHLPATFRGEVGQLERSMSAVCLYAGLREGEWEAPAHETVYFPRWAPLTADGFYYVPGRTDPHPGALVSAPTVTDPSLAPAGCHVVSIMIPVDAQAVEAVRTERGKGFIEDDLLGLMERLIPGSTSCIKYLETATPHTIERYTNNSGGSIYGWAKSSSQRWNNSAGPITPIPGLYLAGHWTPRAHGVYGSFYSGYATARALIEARERPGLIATRA